MISRAEERGAAAIYFLVVATLVIFGFMVFAVDYGRLYLVQGELQSAADAAALAAAKSLVGTANSQVYAGATSDSGQLAAAFDDSDSNDNRFNLHLNKLLPGVGDLATSISVDYFSTRLDALNNGNGGQTGPDAKYVRVQITAQTPVLFPQFLDPTFSSRPVVAVASVAGISSPVCTACAIDDLAVVAPDATDEVNWGFALGNYYTLYMTAAQSCQTAAPATLDANDTAVVEYALLNHFSSGVQTTDADGVLFELGASGILNGPALDPPGTITVGLPETQLPFQDPACTAGNVVAAGQDYLCGLNTRFGEVDPTTNNCSSIASVDVLAASFTPDTDITVSVDSQDYSGTFDSPSYDGNQRRVITVPVIDASDSLNVLGFRQFLVQNTPGQPGIDTSQATGAFRAEYIGYPSPIRCMGTGGSCTVSFGVGRTVLH